MTDRMPPHRPAPAVRPPAELAPAELALLATYRTARAMPPAAKARMLQRLETAPLRAPARLLRGRGRWIAAAVAIAATVAITAGVTALRSDTVEPADAAAAHQAALQGAQQSASQPAVPGRRNNPSVGSTGNEATHAEPPTDNPAPEPDAPATDTAGDAADAPAHDDAPAPRLRGTPRNAASTPSVDDGPAVATSSGLTEEREILSRAWSALAQGDHSRAVTEARLHAQRFPVGLLSVERVAIATIAGCKAKRRGWRDDAAGFLAAHGKTPLARRVREACAPSGGAP